MGGGGFLKRVIAFAVALTLVVGLTPLSSAHAGYDGEYYNILHKSDFPGGKFPQESGMDPLAKNPINITMYMPALDVYVPFDDYKVQYPNDPDVIHDEYSNIIDPATGTYGKFTHIKDSFQAPNEKQTYYENKTLSHPINPIKLHVGDVDPTGAVKLMTSIDYNPAYAEDYADMIDAIKNKKSSLDDNISKSADLMLRMFDNLYPLAASNIVSLSISGALDETMLNNLPWLLEYIATPDAKGFKNLDITSTVPVPAAVVAYWSQPYYNISKGAQDALSTLDIKLSLQNDANSKKFAELIAQYGKKTTIVDNNNNNNNDNNKGTPVATSVKSMDSAVKTINVQQGKSVKIPYVAYAVGAVKNARQVDWRATKSAVASVALNKASGSVWTKALDTKSTLTVKAGKKTGTSKISIIDGGVTKLTLTIKVVKKAKAVNNFTVKAAKTIKRGKTANIKISKITSGGTANIASFKIAKKFSKYLAVDAAGKLTAKAAYKKGKTTIPVTVKVGKKSKVVKVMVK